MGSLLWGKARERGPNFVLTAAGGGNLRMAPETGLSTMGASAAQEGPEPAAAQDAGSQHAGAQGAGTLHELHDLRGSLTLCLIFIAVMAVVYATHWINLAELWPIG